MAHSSRGFRTPRDGRGAGVSSCFALFVIVKKYHYNWAALKSHFLRWTAKSKRNRKQTGEEKVRKHPSQKNAKAEEEVKEATVAACAGRGKTATRRLISLRQLIWSGRGKRKQPRRPGYQERGRHIFGWAPQNPERYHIEKYLTESSWSAAPGRPCALSTFGVGWGGVGRGWYYTCLLLRYLVFSCARCHAVWSFLALDSMLRYLIFSHLGWGWGWGGVGMILRLSLLRSLIFSCARCYATWSSLCARCYATWSCLALDATLLDLFLRWMLWYLIFSKIGVGLGCGGEGVILHLSWLRFLDLLLR